jgi:hypothetical protein
MSLLRAQLHFRGQAVRLRTALSPRVLGPASSWLNRALHAENQQQKQDHKHEQPILLYDNKGKGALVTRLIGVAGGVCLMAFWPRCASFNRLLWRFVYANTGAMSTTYWGVYMYQLSHPELVMPVFTGIPQSVVMGSFGLFFSGVLGFMLTMYSKVRVDVSLEIRRTLCMQNSFENTHMCRG